MQTILLAIDFSPASRNAAIYAAELARLLKVKLLLFHAYMLPAPISEVPYAMVTIDSLQKENEDLVKKEAAFLESTYGVQIERLVRMGMPSDEIKALTQDRQIGLVVMGMKGAGELDKIIGSTTTNVSRKVKTPVLVVPHDAAYKPIHHITYASDFSYKTSTRLFNPLLELARAYQATVHIVHVRLQHDGISEEEAAGRAAAERIFEGVTYQFVTIEDDTVNQGISHYVQQQGSQLLAMVAHKHTFFERVFSRNHTTSMAYETHTPLLILQDKD